MSISVSALLYICHNFNEISTAMFWLELLVVLLAIFLGARIGGIGLGVMGALG